MTGARHFTVIRKPTGRPPQGDADLVYRGASLDLAKSAALAAVALPDLLRAIVYEDALQEDGTFAFTGATWGWAEISDTGRRSLHDVEEEARAAQAKTDAETMAQLVALLGHVLVMLHAGGYTLAETLPAKVKAMVDAGQAGGAVDGLLRVHRELHPGAADPYHEVKAEVPA